MSTGAPRQSLARKQPVQARSKASVMAILDATVQILSTRRTIHLTTKKIAARAGLSVGSVYQYFPNKEAIVLALIARKAEEVTSTFEDAARQQCGRTLAGALRVLIRRISPISFLNRNSRKPCMPPWSAAEEPIAFGPFVNAWCGPSSRFCDKLQMLRSGTFKAPPA